MAAGTRVCDINKQIFMNIEQTKIISPQLLSKTPLVNIQLIQQAKLEEVSLRFNQDSLSENYIAGQLTTSVLQ